ncbi:MAG: hypothetical protein JW809_18325 [Pirellulales bacterium]|nr:hypothetical protein [Pirellulales bacterium]
MKRPQTRIVLLAAAMCAFATAPSGPVATARADEPAATPFNFEEASRDVPKPRELYPLVRQDLVPMELAILSDEIVPSDTDPSKKLRHVTGRFQSIRLEDETWFHTFDLFAPADESVNQSPERRGKAVIVAGTCLIAHPTHVAVYGEPIASKTGYPTLVLSGLHVGTKDHPREVDIAVLDRMRKKTGKNYYNMNCQLALVYIRAMDVIQDVLKLDSVKAVVGGHSKWGRSATVAAAMDPRVAGVVIMGNEGVHRTDQIQWHLSFHHAFFQEQVHVPVLYIGATNEGGYKMFNVNLMQERLRRPMTLEVIPNYHHANLDEKQFIDFTMWVAHVFNKRPITRITELAHERRGNANYYTAKIESKAKIRMVRVWYAYATNPQWSDLMWYDWLMFDRGDHYETGVPGAMPDAFMIEVFDVAQGVPGYVTSLPQKLTDAPVVERDPAKARWMGPPERQGK